MARRRRSTIYVLAGTNGAGKSSVAGKQFRARGSEYFNPDEATAQIRSANPLLPEVEANSAAWLEGLRLLDHAISERLDFNFETTLGGNTIAARLEAAAPAGIAVHIWYVGLATPEMHIQRVRARVERGGHDIPEGKIRERFERSRLNLIRLLPHVAELRFFDNSLESDPAAGVVPQPKLILHWERGRIRQHSALDMAPEWTKPILLAALRLSATSSRRRSSRRS